ncbi:c-type cytochrome [Paraburkholderia sp. Tr-20389]|uniref:c-type cytochrome n=1 Tax=Paraburkholderia sp. Tr-20389 TaxID=2703903 RepID=UPI0019811822|nr:c-type cytochrome [Paraburkholderia sp. Tr-20389]MBN3753577.1 c-type cytochrome [Paraburkholderia sp. Tr-20389]
MARGLVAIAREWRRLLPAFAFTAGLLLSSPGAYATPPVDTGESIFRDGIAGDGLPVEATHHQQLAMRGAAAACANCHRRSGLGSKEGNTTIPPIAAQYLFRPSAQSPDELTVPFIDGMRTARQPYTEATLARAIREGIDSEGRPLGYLMPQFALNDADMRALIDYLRTLDRRRAPGVTDTVLHFATIITPDADPVKRRGMLDVLQHYFADKNAAPLGATPALRSSRKMMFMVNRRWELHVWELHGAPDTWDEQLRRYLAQQPVFAVLSGLGGRNWAPVHDFCEREQVPCLFPNVEVPVESEHDSYSMYFSRGVLLEAQLIAQRMREPAGSPTARPVRSVLQLYRAGDSGEAAAQMLATSLRKQGIAVDNRALPPNANVATALHHAPHADALMLWLRPPDLAALGDAPPASTAVYVSGIMGGLDRAPLPAKWRTNARLAYPVDLPQGRRVRVDYAFGWFAIRHIPVVDERVQADTYLACGLLAETLSHMVDAFVRDYLVERIDDMLEHRILTGYYPRLTLAPGQRFASKGGYIVRFAEPDRLRVVADSDWIVP